MLISFVFFFFKQKTAYEIYQCDWSSDVCSSDLLERFIEDCAESWDCDTGVNCSHSYYCRKCQAKKIMGVE